VYCVAHAVKNCQNVAISTKFLHFGAFVSNPLPIRANFSSKQSTGCLHLHAKFHLNPSIVSPFRDKKLHYLANFDIWGLLYPAPFTDKGQIWHARADAEQRYTLIRQISSRLVYSVALWQRKTPNFVGFQSLAFCDVANWQRTDKVECGSTTANLPQTSGITTLSIPPTASWRNRTQKLRRSKA